MSTETAELQILLDKQACNETLTRYCRALNWLDKDVLKTVFTPDADIDYGFFKGRGEEFIAADDLSVAHLPHQRMQNGEWGKRRETSKNLRATIS